MKNRFLKYCFIMLAFLVAQQSISADTLKENTSVEPSFNSSSISRGVLQLDSDDLSHLNLAAFKQTNLSKQFFYTARYFYNGTISNHASQMNAWLKVKLQV